MTTLQRIANPLALIGLLLIVAATMMPLLRLMPQTFGYIYAAGAVLLIIGRLLQPAPAPGTSLRRRRLQRLLTWSALTFAVAAGFLFYPGAAPRDWLAFTIAGAVLQAYASLMLSRKSVE